jgi:hypothetical protein
MASSAKPKLTNTPLPFLIIIADSNLIRFSIIIMSVSRCSCAPRELNLRLALAKTYSETNTLVKNVGISDSLCQLDVSAVTILSAQASGEDRNVCDIFPDYKPCKDRRKMLADVGDEKKNDSGIFRRQLEEDGFEYITSYEVFNFDSRLATLGSWTYELDVWDRAPIQEHQVAITADPCKEDTFGSVISFEGIGEWNTSRAEYSY